MNDVGTARCRGATPGWLQPAAAWLGLYRHSMLPHTKSGLQLGLRQRDGCSLDRKQPTYASYEAHIYSTVLVHFRGFRISSSRI